MATDMTNEKPGERENERHRGQVTGSAADVYEQFFVPALFGQWVDRLLDAASVGAANDVLDVGWGTGIVARGALERVGADGRAAGIDPNAGMLSVARAIEPRVEWHQGTAEELPFADAAFDRTLSQFAAMFFDDRRRAVDEMMRVTRPGGQVAIATWAAIEQSPGYAAMVELLDRVIGRWAADALGAPFVIGTEEAAAELFAQIDARVTVRRLSGEARFASIDAWLHTDVRGWTLADGIDDEQYDALLGEAHRSLQPFTGDDGAVAFAAPALIATLTVPTS